MLLLVAHALTPSLRHQMFGGDDEPDRSALLAIDGERVSGTVLSSPARAAMRTAEAFGAAPRIEQALRDREYGEWTGRAYAELVVEQPDAVRRWIADPYWAPPGGESVEQLVDRVGGWLSDAGSVGGWFYDAGSVVAVTHPVVIRAALIHVRQAPLDSFRHIDVRPLDRFPIE